MTLATSRGAAVELGRDSTIQGTAAGQARRRTTLIWCAALSVASVLGLPAHAAVTLTGDTSPAPGNEGSIDSSTPLLVGVTGVGGLTVDAGSDIASSFGDVGSQTGSSGTATVTGAGSSWSNTGGLNVGDFGDGTLSILSGATVSNGSGTVGNAVNRTGSVTVNGGGSAWNNAASLTIANQGSGTLTIEDGGSVTNTSGFISNSNGSSGEVTVTGTGSTWMNSSSAFIGNSSNGTLTIENDGAFSSGDLTVGNFDGAVGAATVQNGGSITSTEMTISNFGGSQGTLDVLGGGLVQSTGDLTIANSSGSNGTVNLNGGTLDLGGNDAAFGDGAAAFNFTAGTLADVAAFQSDLLQQGGTLQIGSSGSSPSTMTVEGDYTLENGASLELDLFGDGGVAGTDFDQLTVDGTASLAGTLEVLLEPGYTPVVDQTWDVLSAESITLESGWSIAPGSSFEAQVISGSTDDTLRVTRIPEPTSAALWLLATLGALARSNRRNMRTSTKS